MPQVELAADGKTAELSIAIECEIGRRSTSKGCAKQNFSETLDMCRVSCACESSLTLDGIILQCISNDMCAAKATCNDMCRCR